MKIKSFMIKNVILSTWFLTITINKVRMEKEVCYSQVHSYRSYRGCRQERYSNWVLRSWVIRVEVLHLHVNSILCSRLNGKTQALNLFKELPCSNDSFEIVVKLLYSTWNSMVIIIEHYFP